MREIKDPVLIHYGGYEAAFLKRMRERYPTDNPTLLEKLIKESVNVLAFIYGQVYFPTHSNSLKDIAGFLGFSWPDNGTRRVFVQSSGGTSGKNRWNLKPNKSSALTTWLIAKH